MQRRAWTLLRDMRDHARQAERFAEGRDYADYLGNDMLRAAVEREVMIVGEALYQISEIEPDWQTLVTDARAIVRTRHILVHGYSKVQPDVIWDIVRQDLPSLRREVDALLTQEPPV
jgi:uncharacterized protein with HEPN domain